MPLWYSLSSSPDLLLELVTLFDAILTLFHESFFRLRRVWSWSAPSQNPHHIFPFSFITSIVSPHQMLPNLLMIRKPTSPMGILASVARICISCNFQSSSSPSSDLIRCELLLGTLESILPIFPRNHPQPSKNFRKMSPKRQVLAQVTSLLLLFSLSLLYPLLHSQFPRMNLLHLKEQEVTSILLISPYACEYLWPEPFLCRSHELCCESLLQMPFL